VVVRQVNAPPGSLPRAAIVWVCAAPLELTSHAAEAAGAAPSSSKSVRPAMRAGAAIEMRVRNRYGHDPPAGVAAAVFRPSAPPREDDRPKGRPL